MDYQNIFVGKLPPDDPAFKLKPHLQPASNVIARLTVVRGAQTGEVFPLSPGTFMFGRIEGILLRDVLASRRHMEIQFDGCSFILDDLQSTNGTYINGKPVQQSVYLHHGDFIRVGETILAFEIIGNETSVLGFGAQTKNPVDHRQNEITIQMKSLIRTFARAEV